MIYGNKEGFNPCFNGSMYKNIIGLYCLEKSFYMVSILVLMDLCIKTAKAVFPIDGRPAFQSLF